MLPLVSEQSTEGPGNDLYQKWVAAIINRSPEAWDELLGAYSNRLRRDVQISLHKWGLPPEYIEDIEQETWLRALRKIQKFVWEDDEKFYRWLRAISSKCIYELQRNTDRTLSLDDMEQDDSDVDIDDLFARFSLSDGNVEDQVILHERMVALERALKTLKVEEREIYMRWLMGERPRSLALNYQKRVGTISHLLYRASKKIEAYLNNKDDDHE